MGIRINKRSAPLLRGVFFITFAFFFLSIFTSELIWALTGTNPPVLNPAKLNPAPMIGAFLIVVLLTVFIPKPRSLFLGFILGGMLSNYFASVFFSPVGDFIFLPGSGDLYFNIADVGIIAGPILYFIFLIVEVIKEEIAYKRSEYA